jgi:hypothetical protein
MHLYLPHPKHEVFYISAYILEPMTSGASFKRNLTLVLDVDLGPFSPCSYLGMQDLGGL